MRALNELTKDKFMSALEQAKETYGALSLTKSRREKLKKRWPKDITDKNVHKKLLKFLNGPGGDGQTSYKCQVVSHLFNSVFNEFFLLNEEAKMLIEGTKESLQIILRTKYPTRNPFEPLIKSMNRRGINEDVIKPFIQKNQIDFFKFLLYAIDINKNIYINYILLECLYKDKSDFLEIILNHPNFTIKEDIVNLVAYAISNHFTQATKTLLKKIKDSGSHKLIRQALSEYSSGDPYEASTVMHIAVRKNNTEIVKAFVDFGLDADLLDSHNKRSDKFLQTITPLSEAIRLSMFDMVKCLNELGADPTKRNTLNQSPLEVSLLSGYDSYEIAIYLVTTLIEKSMCKKLADATPIEIMENVFKLHILDEHDKEDYQAKFYILKKLFSERLEQIYTSGKKETNHSEQIMLFALSVFSKPTKDIPVDSKIELLEICKKVTNTNPIELIKNVLWLKLQDEKKILFLETFLSMSSKDDQNEKTEDKNEEPTLDKAFILQICRAKMDMKHIPNKTTDLKQIPVETKVKILQGLFLKQAEGKAIENLLSSFTDLTKLNEILESAADEYGNVPHRKKKKEKLKQRWPKNTTRENLHEKFLEFLNGEGGSGPLSYKYQVVSQIIFDGVFSRFNEGFLGERVQTELVEATKTVLENVINRKPNILEPFQKPIKTLCRDTTEHQGLLNEFIRTNQSDLIELFLDEIVNAKSIHKINFDNLMKTATQNGNSSIVQQLKSFRLKTEQEENEPNSTEMRTFGPGGYSKRM